MVQYLISVIDDTTNSATAEEMAAILDRWLGDERALADVREEMRQLRENVVQTGGVERAAAAILARLLAAQSNRLAA